VQSELKDQRLTAEIQFLLEGHYDLGELIHLEEILGGYCNKSYGLTAARGGASRKFLLRGYNPRIVESEIRFEHALIKHLRRNGFDLAAEVIACRDGGSHVKGPPSGGDHHIGFWALFAYLEGKDKYSWTQTDLNPKEFASCAGILAQLHHAGHGFVRPPGADRAQPGIMAFMPTFKPTYDEFLLRAAGRRCDRLFNAHLNRIRAVIDQCCAAGKHFKGMPEMPIHCDYHPGNLKYRDNRGVGLFDFDWAKIDYRLFDLALALVYFCGVWRGPSAGSLDPDKLALFLKNYGDGCRHRAGITPLTEQEKSGLPKMMAAANLYVLHWGLMDFYGGHVPDDDEYYVYIRHNIGLMEWIESHSADILQTAAG